MIRLDLSNIVNVNKINKYEGKVKKINQMINDKTGAGNDYLGWADWPINYDKAEVKTMIKCADYVRNNFDILVVCGIGGSYLGARAAIEALRGLYSNDKMEIIYLSTRNL